MSWLNQTQHDIPLTYHVHPTMGFADLSPFPHLVKKLLTSPVVEVAHFFRRPQQFYIAMQRYIYGVAATHQEGPKGWLELELGNLSVDGD